MRPAPPSFRSAHTMTAPVKDTARRQFILDTTKMACGMGVLGLGLGLVNKQAKALPAGAIRPPINPTIAAVRTISGKGTFSAKIATKAAAAMAQ